MDAPFYYDLNIPMPDNTPDYLQFALENIVKEISEVKALITDTNKTNSDFKDQILTRVTALEMRVNSIEVEKNVVKGILSSDWIKKVLGFAFAGVMGYLGANSEVLKLLLGLFK